MAQILQLDSRFRAGFVSRSAAGLAIPDTRLRSLRSRPPTSSCCLASARREDSDWQVAAFHNTARQSIKERMSFRLAPETMPAALRRTD